MLRAEGEPSRARAGEGLDRRERTRVGREAKKRDALAMAGRLRRCGIAPDIGEAGLGRCRTLFAVRPPAMPRLLRKRPLLREGRDARSRVR